MKKKFKCHKCGQFNEFETEGAIVRLMEAANSSAGRTYFVECKWCGTQNTITIEEDSK